MPYYKYNGTCRGSGVLATVVLLQLDNVLDFGSKGKHPRHFRNSSTVNKSKSFDFTGGFMLTLEE